ncbi:C-type lectin 1-like [Branchiostoma floridae]|uniref:C-type lectin 1-like n=1 Tax=Branchiostoma floridae TaxID=7739 RepID=A0A9J7NCB2_BRAFL|nr:C-type lectin 1-like [Branchiostoma floridae]
MCKTQGAILATITSSAENNFIKGVISNDINECKRNPCRHGRCVNKDGGYKCTCSLGWTGQDCQRVLKCPGDWRKYNNHCYKLMTTTVSWSTARSRCRQHGAMLTSINGQGENNFVKNLISGYPYGKRNVKPIIWMGLQKGASGWKWTDGSKFDYSNWAPGEPGKRKDMNCAIVYSKDYRHLWIFTKKLDLGEWDDFKCRVPCAYVCEKSV